MVTYSVKESVYAYDVENIINMFGFAKVREGGDLLLEVEDGQLCLRGLDVDFSAPLFCSKNELKRRLYRYLTEKFGAVSGWGILVGVRPVKLAVQMLEEGCSEAEVVRNLQEEYLLSAENAALLTEVALHEHTVAPGSSASRPVSLYVSVPFCPTRCRYCSFPMQPLSTKRKLLVPYFRRLCEELEMVLGMLRDLSAEVDCVYFGGGTPSTLECGMISELGDLLDSYVPREGIGEFTFEAGRTDTISDDLLDTLKMIGADRISVNPQSFTPEALEYAFRGRVSGEFEKAFRMAKERGFRINSDLILGLERETADQYLEGLAHLIASGADDITVHALALKRGAALFGAFEAGNASGYARMRTEGEAMLREAGYRPYYLYRQKRILANLENIGFTKGSGCLYNSRMMSERYDIVAVGTGGVSKICFPSEHRHEQIAGTRSVEEYIERFDKTREKVDRIANLLKV